MSSLVLLTGISGYLGGHIALALLEAGYAVRGSVRSLARADKVRDALAAAGADVSRLEFVELDLTSDTGWDAVMDGVRYLQHTASPFALQMPQDRMELIGPAVQGTERALNAALRAGVERIVLTSSMAAIAYGHDRSRTTPFAAADWTDLEGRGINAYVESKTRAERRAWEVMKGAERTRDLATINPSVILGPLLDDDPGVSVTMMQRVLNGSIPALPRIPLVLVDVRDVAQAHVAAMTAPEAGGKRFPMGESTMFFSEAARILKQKLPRHAGKVPALELPDWVVRIYALFDKDLRGNLGELGVRKHLDSRDAVALLGRPLIPARKSIVDTAESLVERGLV